MSPALLTIATVQVGNRYPDEWVRKLASMVAKNLQEEHRFIVYTDQPSSERFGQPSSPWQTIEIVDLQAETLRGFFAKLRLFDQNLTGTEPFLFLDSTLIIRSSLAPLIKLGQNMGSALTGVQDWNYPILNSSVLWLQPNEHTQNVWQAWQQGHYADETFPGDQNFIFRVFEDRTPLALKYWPAGLVCSYKRLRKLAARDAAAARRQLEACTILKFHGRPKPEEVLHPWRHPSHTILRNPLQPHLWSYLADEVACHWR